MNRSHPERGSAIIMLFIAVALFAALAYAFMQGSKGSTALVTNEAAKASATASQDCTNIVNMAIKRLELKGCANKVSFNGDGTNDQVGAPADGSCSIFHPNGGGVKACNELAVCSGPQLASLAIGGNCNGIIYAGMSGGNRIYVKATDQSAGISYNNGAITTVFLPTAESTSDGLANTNALMALSNGESPYKAAALCRALGTNWYLPSVDEMQVIHDNRALIGGFGPYYFWTSTSFWNNSARFRSFIDANNGNNSRDATFAVRCARR
jgi:hypothetical protein